ncbi:hypothetical protein BB561_005417 [Smittium simulii]|uniref:Uncharacterized protein n=1 Tax=Smittium simulii TaxID=133385 RepID=A0A2T9YAH2_9FUNG|nr:hypothetical protein BB561_005417 [Smittium simulii]
MIYHGPFYTYKLQTTKGESSKHSIAVFAVALSTGLASIYPLRASTAVNFFFFDSDIGKGHKKSTAHSSNIPEISEHPSFGLLNLTLIHLYTETNPRCPAW